MSKVLFLGALGQNQTLVSYGYNEFRISRIWMRRLFASAGQVAEPSYRYILTIFPVRHLWVIIIIKKTINP